MISITHRTVAGPVGELAFREDPRRHPHGIHTDLEGVQWHCHGVSGGCILAAPLWEMDDYWARMEAYPGAPSDASWRPYRVRLLPDVADNQRPSSGGALS